MEQINATKDFLWHLFFGYKELINMLKKTKLNINSIIELGGADSCFYETLRKEFNNCDYTVIDNSKVGIDIFNEKYKKRR